MSISPKSKPKFIQQHHLPTLSKFHKPPTLSKLHHEEKNKTSRMIQSQHFQTWSITQCPQNFQTTKWQYLTMKLSMKHATALFPAKKPKKTHLGVYMTIWSMGPRSWRSPSSSCHSNVGSYFLPWEARKEDPLEEEAILIQRKWVSPKMGVWWKCSKHKDLKKYWRRWMRKGGEA